VDIREGGPGITPEEVVAAGHADFGINWLPSLLASREAGLRLQNIAQLFERSAMTGFWLIRRLSSEAYAGATSCESVWPRRTNTPRTLATV
jgi:hypothetical protein